MNEQKKDLPPLKDITTSGIYRLKLTKPKEEKLRERFKLNKKDFASCRLFFVDPEGNCMTKNFSVEFGKGLAMLVGKLSNSFVKEPSQSISVEQLIKFVEPAFNKSADFELEVAPDKEWNGKMQYNYRIKKINAIKPGQGSSESAETTGEAPF